MPGRYSPATIEQVASAIRPGETLTVREVLPRLDVDLAPATVRNVLYELTRAGRLEAIEDASHPIVLVKRYRQREVESCL